MCVTRWINQVESTMIISATNIPSSANWAQVGGLGGLQQTNPCSSPSRMPTKPPAITPSLMHSLVFTSASCVNQDRKIHAAQVVPADGGEDVHTGADQRSGRRGRNRGRDGDGNHYILLGAGAQRDTRWNDRDPGHDWSRYGR